jgi:hypothetical protein
MSSRIPDQTMVMVTGEGLDQYGQYGQVVEFAFDRYVVEIDGAPFAFFDGEITPILMDQDLLAQYVSDYGSPRLIEPSDINKSTYDEEGSDEETDPAVPKFGMSSADLAEFTEAFLRRTTGRILGVGHEQYSFNGFQKFEGMTVEELLEMTLEELEDAAVYSSMLWILVARLRVAYGS